MGGNCSEKNGGPVGRRKPINLPSPVRTIKPGARVDGGFIMCGGEPNSPGLVRMPTLSPV